MHIKGCTSKSYCFFSITWAKNSLIVVDMCFKLVGGRVGLNNSSERILWL